MLCVFDERYCGMKPCSKCGLAKDESKFYRMSMTPDGLRPDCKDCNKKLQHIYNTSEQGRKTDKARRIRDSVKVKARDALRSKINGSKKITRQSCEICGVCPAEGHHPDYTKPLDVEWLCTEHHNELHRKERDESYQCVRSP